MSAERKIVVLALRDFAVPVPRTGSIETHSGYGRAAAEGRDIHVRVQKKRAKSDPAYEPEVPVTCFFDKGAYRFRVDGRMDGLFRSDPPKIEEIKTAFAVRDLGQRLAEETMTHPYCLQLRTYGYAYWLEHNVVPRLSFHIVSTRNNASFDLEQTFDLSLYGKWLDARLDELAVEAKKAEKRAARRRKAAIAFPFPFDKPRPGQIELMETIETGLKESRPLLIQAPTGLGKTAGVLYPVLREALSRGQKTVYVTPKNSQHAVAEDAVARFQEAGAKIKSLTITAKGKICFKNEPLCDPGFCEYSGDYYAKVQENGILGLLAKKKKLRARAFRELGEEFEVCPFELQFDGAEEADVVICDYNYVFAPRSSFGRLATSGLDQAGKPDLVIDEAHNLPSRAMDYYSPALSSLTLEQMRGGLGSIAGRFQRDAEELLDACIETVRSSGPEGGPRPVRIDPPHGPFLEQDAKLRAFLSRYLDSDAEIQPRDPVMGLCFYWSEFAEALEYVADGHEEFFTTFHPHPTGGTVRITCCDASDMLRDCYKDYDQVVGFSATLKPFDYYAGLAGLDPANVRTAEFPSPFPRERRKLLIIPQVSTRYADRERNYGRISGAIGRIAALRRGNYFVFFPSFEFLERVFALFRAPAGFTVMRQERDMKSSGAEALLAHLREGREPTIVFAVQGGTFSEGVDYPGEMVIGAFVIGPPLPNFSLEREEMRAYYERRYGAGFDYAYAIPAMAKAVQAAGRVIRSDADRGLIVLMDSRFVRPGYSRAMPADWFDSGVNELMSKSILKEVADFWNGAP